MVREEHLLVKVGEECAEMAHRSAKALRFGLQQVQKGHTLNNQERILDEFKDLIIALHMLGMIPYVDTWVMFLALNPLWATGNFDPDSRIGNDARNDVMGRIDRVEQYLLYSKSVGTLTEDRPVTMKWHPSHDMKTEETMFGVSTQCQKCMQLSTESGAAFECPGS